MTVMPAADRPAVTALPSASVIPPLHRDRPQVVIVGGGFGGLTAAKALSSVPADVALVDRRNHHVFQPLLYQVATAGLSPGDIASPIRFILRRQRNLRVLLAEALAVDAARRRLVMDVGEIAYDYLVVATGATHAYFGHDEWQQVAPGLKSLEDALAVRRRVLMAFEHAERSIEEGARRRALTFVIIGGGPTGVELAGALAEIARRALRDEFDAIRPEDSRILLLEGGPDVLTAFPDALRRHARASLQRLGVEVLTNTKVTRVAEGLVEAGDVRIEADTILWAAGVAASPLGRTLGAPVDAVGRVIVRPDLSIDGHPEVFVIGDLAHLAGRDGKPLPGVAPVALQQGTYVARLIAAAVRSRGDAPERRPFHYVNFGNLATIGRASAIADFGWVRFKGYFAWLLWLFVHIMKLTGFRNRLLVLMQWAWAYVTYQRSVRLITGEEAPPSHAPSRS
jgi:NADH dehydrogenase